MIEGLFALVGFRNFDSSFFKSIILEPLQSRFHKFESMSGFIRKKDSGFFFIKTGLKKSFLNDIEVVESHK